MNWRELYPEGSVVFIDGDRFELKHNPHTAALDLYQRGELMITINAKILPRIADGVRYTQDDT